MTIKHREVTLEVGDSSIQGIPEDIWIAFRENAKKQFPNDGDDAWVKLLSEVIFAVGGGNGDTVTQFMTDIPIANERALQNTLAQANWTWEQFHAYLLRVAVMPGHLRVINFTDKPISYGTFIATGIRPEAFGKFRAATGYTIEDFLATFFNGLASADPKEIKLEGNLPDHMRKNGTSD